MWKVLILQAVELLQSSSAPSRLVEIIADGLAVARSSRDDFANGG